MPRESESALQIGRQPVTLARLLQVARRVTELGLSVAAPARVLEYDAAAQTVKVEIGFKAVRYTVDSQVPVPAIVMSGITVGWQRGSTGYSSHPLLPGATGQLIVNDRALSQWRRLGIAEDPQQTHTHNMGDATFYPGLHPDTNPITPPTDQTASVFHDDIAISLGRLATLAVARLTDSTAADASMSLWLIQVTAAILAMQARFNAPAAPMVSAPGSVPVFPAATPSDFGLISSGSSKVRAE